jgi:hypothetical protein
VRLTQPWVEATSSPGSTAPGGWAHGAVSRRPRGSAADVTPPGSTFATRSTSTAGTVRAARGTVVFANFEDQRLYRQDPGVAPRPIPRAARARCPPVRRPARVARRARRRVRERHAGGEGCTDERAGDARVRRLGRAARGRLGPRLHASPRFFPTAPGWPGSSGTRPHAWDGTELMVADVVNGRVGGAACGGSRPSRSSSPVESRGIRISSGPDRVVERVPRGSRRDATEPGAARGEFGVPQEFGYATYAFLSDAHRLRVPTTACTTWDARPDRPSSSIWSSRTRVSTRRTCMPTAPGSPSSARAHRATAGGDARLRHAGGRRAPRRRGGRRRCGVPFGAGGDLVPDGRRCGVRVPLPADEP